MRFFVTISVIFFTSHIVFSQENNIVIPLWIIKAKADSIYKKDNFISLISIDCKSKELEKKKKEYTPRLKTRLASGIYSTIESELRTTSNETTSNETSTFTSTYKSNISMATKVDLTDFEVKVYFDKKKEKLHLIIIQNKKKLKVAYESKIKISLTDLMGDVKQNFEYKRKDQLVSEKGEMEKKARLISEKIQFFTFLSASSGDKALDKALQFQTDLNSYKITISNLTALINDKAFEEKFSDAQKLFNDGDCRASYAKLQELFIENSSDKRVLTLLEESRSCQTDKMEREVNDEYAKHNYENSIIIIDELIELNARYKEDEHYIKLKSVAFDKYINKKFQQIDNIIEVDFNEAEGVFVSIKWYGQSSEQYKSKYDSYDCSIRQKKTNDLKLKFKNHIHKDEFREAHQIILKIFKNSENGDVQETTFQLNKKWEKKVKKYAKKKMLFDRPHLYSLKLNASLFSPTISYEQLKNPNDFLNSLDRNTNYLYPYYSIAFYRKFNEKAKFGLENHRDKSSSYLIGIKAGIQDVINGIHLQGPKDTLIGINNKLNYEFQISSLLLRCLNLNYGLFLNKIDNSTGSFFTTTFGFKIPIWRFDLDMNLKYLSDYRSEHHFLMEGGISLNFNYIRRFVREDKDQLKLNIENYK